MNAGTQERPRRVALLIAVALFVVAADVISKAVVVATMAAHPPIRLPLDRHRSVEVIHSVEVLERIDYVFFRKEDILYSDRRTVV